MRKNYREDELPPLMDSPAAQPAPAPQSPPDVQSVLGDPAFRAFLAQRAQALSQAQTEATGRQRWADVAGAFERGGAMIGNRPVDRDQIASLNARAQSPVTQLQQRQAGESQAIKDVDVAQQMQERGAKASRMRAEDDPKSDLSQRAKMLAVAQKLIPAGYAGPYSASMHQDMLKGASIEQARAHSTALEAQAKASMAETHASHQETGRHNKEMEDIARGKSGKSTAVLTKELAHAADAVKQLDDYGTQGSAEGSGPLHGVNAAINPYAAGDRTTRGMAQALSIVVARGLHGGAPTKVELEEAQQYIPQTSDPPETFQRKLAAIRKTLVDRQEELKSTMAALGNPKAANLPDMGGVAAGDAPKAKAAPAKAAGGTVRVREKASGKVKSLPADQAQSVLADPRFEQAP
jgi:hypothetical protein